MRRLRGPGIAFVLLLSGGVAPGCLFCGGQTGECGASDSESGGSIDCVTIRRGYLDRTVAGHSAEDVVQAHGGTYEVIVDLTSADAAVVAQAEPATLAIAYDGGAVTEDSCSHDLAIDVTVTVTIGEGTVARTGPGRLVGDPAAAHLAVSLPAGGDAVAGVVTVAMSLAGDGSATGTVDLGDSGPLPFTAARQP